MLDLQFGLPIQVRDAALKLVKQGPSSEINREYYAQNQTGKHQDGEVPAEYGKAESAARDLLKRLARSEPYRRKQQAMEDEKGTNSTLRIKDAGPMRSAAQSRPSVSDIMPPKDTSITSLFIMGIEDDLPEHALRQFFAKYGQIKSLVCSHRSRCAFVNYTSRAAAEAASEACQGEALIRGCPLRIQWGKPRALGGGYKAEQRNAEIARLALGKPSRIAIEGHGDHAGGEIHISRPPAETSTIYNSMRDDED